MYHTICSLKFNLQLNDLEIFKDTGKACTFMEKYIVYSNWILLF